MDFGQVNAVGFLGGGWFSGGMWTNISLEKVTKRKRCISKDKAKQLL
jgi:hypothetical protein